MTGGRGFAGRRRQTSQCARVARGALFRGEALVNQLLERLDALSLRGERRLLIHLLRDAQCVGGIKLTVKVSMDQQHGVIVGL